MDLTLDLIVLNRPFLFHYAVLAIPLLVVEGAIGAIFGRRIGARIRPRSLV